MFKTRLMVPLWTGQTIEFAGTLRLDVSTLTCWEIKGVPTKPAKS